MLALVNAIESAIEAVSRLRKSIAKNRAQRQVRGLEERTVLKATAHAWFQNHRPALIQLQNAPAFATVDDGFKELLAWSEQNIARRKYLDRLNTLKAALVELRSSGVVGTSDPVRPNFGALIADATMLTILNRRWAETIACQKVNADLAATVMLGGLLEALILTRINQLPNQAAAFTAAAAPKDRQGKTKPLKEWGLKDFLDVANELRWIRQSAKDVGEVLRDYRNYIHPEKERSHGVTINSQDTSMFITVFCSIADQIIASV